LSAPIVSSFLSASPQIIPLGVHASTSSCALHLFPALLSAQFTLLSFSP
jgi:hypothetical protein